MHTPLTSLSLDARQRAMLQEMGVTVWGLPKALAPAPSVPHASPASDSGAVAPRRAAVALAPPPAPAGAPTAAPAPARPSAARMASPGAGSAAAPMAGNPLPALQLHTAQALYPTADPAQVPKDLGGAWLIVAETQTPDQPLGGDAGRLLDNMLRAMQLHRHPRVYLAALERAGPQGPAHGDICAALADTVAALQPALVLVLGHVAARVALGRTEPLGRLRAGSHQVAGYPAVVTYDPAFLLRTQEAKAAAWADLCRALALVRGAAPSD